MSIIRLPPDRRAELDGALQRVTETLAHDAPLFAQIDCFREHVNQEPSLAEWCLWFAEMPDEPYDLDTLQDFDGQNIVLHVGQRLHRLRLLWAGALEQAEPDKTVPASWLRSGTFYYSRWRLVQNTAPAWRRSFRAPGSSSTPRPPADFAERPEMIRDFKRRVLSLFPEVIVWEQEFTKLTPLIDMNRDAVASWHQLTRADVEAQGWGKHKEQGSDLWISYDDLARCVYYTERLYANQLILGEGGKPIAPAGVRKPPHSGPGMRAVGEFSATCDPRKMHR